MPRQIQSHSLPLTTGTNTDQTKPKTPVATMVQNPTTPASDTATDYKHRITGCISPIQHQKPDAVCGIPAVYESDDSWDTALTIDLPLEENNTALLTYRSRSGNNARYPWGTNCGCPFPWGLPVRNCNEPGPCPWDNQPYGCRTRSQEALRAHAYKKWAQHDQQNQ